MGFAIPARVGVQVANRQLRPLVLVGDGAFQMTCMELSSTVRQKFNPIVIVLNNKGYSTERFIQEGQFNDIHNWQDHKMPEYGQSLNLPVCPLNSCSFRVIQLIGILRYEHLKSESFCERSLQSVRSTGNFGICC